MATRKDLASSLRLPCFACALQLLVSLKLLVKLVTCYWVKNLIHESDLTICPLSWFQLTFYVSDYKIYFLLFSPLTWTPNHISKCLLNISTGGPTESLNPTYQNMNSTFHLLPSLSPSFLPTHLQSVEGELQLPRCSTEPAKGLGLKMPLLRFKVLEAPTSCQKGLSLFPDSNGPWVFLSYLPL